MDKKYSYIKFRLINIQLRNWKIKLKHFKIRDCRLKKMGTKELEHFKDKENSSNKNQRGKS